MKTWSLVTGLFIALGGVAVADGWSHPPDGEAPSIARWYNNMDAAVSLRFDDALDSHVDFVIPALNAYGIKATFMVNPGKGRYLKRKSFWEREVPAMGHHLGNHTMNHRGARTVQEAEYEIGEVSRLIRDLCPGQGRLMAFASGGGVRCTWGGRRWSDAMPEYRRLTAKYGLVDLYDGNHPAMSVRSTATGNDIARAIDEAVRTGRHLPILFHKVGDPNAYDTVKALLYGFDNTVRQQEFANMVRQVYRSQERVWVAPLMEILKYEQELSGATIRYVGGQRRSMAYRLTVSTDNALYDQELTVNVRVGGKKISRVLQNGKAVNDYRVTKGMLSANVVPIDSRIELLY